MASDFKLPELGENVDEGDVVRVLVREGDTITRDQPVLELETDKATIEVPSSVAGLVTAVKVSEGDKVRVGQIVLTVEADGAGAPAAPRAATPPAEPAAAPRPHEAPPVAPEPPGREEPAEAAPPTAARRAEPSSRGEVVEMSRVARPAAAAAQPARRVAPASPAVRRLARELGVDVTMVRGSGPAGRISADDVKAHAKQLVTGGSPGSGAPAPVELPDFTRWGDVERAPMRAVRRKTAEHLSTAWTTIPHVTQFDKADITSLETLRKQFGARVEAAGGKLTVTAVMLKVLAGALKVFPQFNASVDMARQEIVLKKYVHIGVAVDTDRGLLVPVIRDVDAKNIVQLAVELAEASERARTRKTTLEEMEGGSMTVTNLGGIGGTAFTPIVNHPEVAILGLSRGRLEPVYLDGAFAARLMLPLSLSYDHRVIDGADAMRFLRWVVAALEQPFLLSLEG